MSMGLDQGDSPAQNAVRSLVFAGEGLKAFKAVFASVEVSVYWLDYGG